jgi:hypothetical protein
MMPTSPIWSLASTFPIFVAVALDGAVEGPEAGVASEFAGEGAGGRGSSTIRKPDSSWVDYVCQALMSG